MDDVQRRSDVTGERLNLHGEAGHHITGDVDSSMRSLLEKVNGKLDKLIIDVEVMSHKIKNISYIVKQNETDLARIATTDSRRIDQ